MKQSSLIILIVVILAAIGIAGYFIFAKPNGSAPAGNPPAVTTNQATSTTAAPSSTITYTNNTYGFTFTLPADWQGYSVLTESWTGNVICSSDHCPTETGPEILIRNPLWTASNTYQDIPILIFTSSEWNAIASETLAIGAAPIPPSKLGSNANYTFALPARYNYAYPNGWQEVQMIMQGNPLQAF